LTDADLAGPELAGPELADPGLANAGLGAADPPGAELAAPADIGDAAEPQAPRPSEARQKHALASTTDRTLRSISNAFRGR